MTAGGLQYGPEGETPVELYGPEDGGWYTTRVYDWIALCPALKDSDVRGYNILRSLVIEKYKNPVRKLTLAVLCELIPGPKGKPSSLTRVRDILAGLSAVGLVSTPEGGPVKTSSRASAARKPIRLRINDMPAEGYTGWRNTEAKLAAITQRVEEAEAGRNSDPGEGAEEGAGRNSTPPGWNSDPRGRKSDPDPAPELEEPDLPLVPTVGTEQVGEAASPRSGVDGRRPSSTGSSVRAREGGCAASSKNQPSPTQHDDQSQAGRKAPHTKQQLDTARKVCAFYPPELRIRLVPALTQAILDALAGDVPGADRTVGQLGARIQRRWDHHGYAAKFHAGELTNPVGAAIAMVRPLKASDRYGCANPRCEDGVDVDTGAECPVCPERIAARKAERRQGADDTSRAERSSKGGRGYRECACGNPLIRSGDESMCGACREASAVLAAVLGAAPTVPGPEPEENGADLETARLRAQYAARYGTPEQVEAYCINAPF